ncbi:hypothetical protein HU200_058361 [Digitaria exilis]|uniref:DUF4220 domain-containing protein n=1 Tax=Digitaria exilis TaxID=1010633 RepID=A0A835A9V4_9POAL|nr:hypothetical protein HU200_058361 [Digitaria exilis]
MALAPSLPPSPTPSDLVVFDLFYVIALVFLAMAAIFLLHILGPLRRWLNHGLLHNIVMGVYALAYPLVGYIIGQMQSSNWYVKDFTVWAVFLLLLLSSTDSLTACRLSDIDSWKSIYVKQLFKGFMLVFIIVTFAHDMENKVNVKYLWYPLSAIMFVIIIKSYVMIASMRMVSKCYIGKNVKVVAEYMQYIDNKLVDFDPMTMGGYRYIIAGEKHCVNHCGHIPWYKKPDNLKITTVEQIWQCDKNLLTGDRGKGRKNSVKLSENVMNAIIDFLIESHGHLTNGVASLEKNGVLGDLSWACDATTTDGAVSRTILVWHIATTLCEHQLDKQGREEEAVRKASTLSKYCMHLLAFAPNLLPDHSSISESILDQSIDKGGGRWQELDKVLEGDTDLESRFKELLKVNIGDGDVSEAPLVAQGVHLARQIGMQDSKLQWKILSDFWVEMMAYISPSNDAWAHLEVLARGGEFITHLWALLTHAGVLKRSPTVPKGVV